MADSYPRRMAVLVIGLASAAMFAISVAVSQTARALDAFVVAALDYMAAPMPRLDLVDVTTPRVIGLAPALAFASRLLARTHKGHGRAPLSVAFVGC